MNWIVQGPSGDTRLLALSDAEVAIIAECAVAIDGTLAALGIELDEEYWNRENPFPALWVETMI